MIAFDLIGTRATQLAVRLDEPTLVHGPSQPDVLLRMDFSDSITRVCRRAESPPVEIRGDETIGTRALDALRLTE